MDILDNTTLLGRRGRISVEGETVGTSINRSSDHCDVYQEEIFLLNQMRGHKLFTNPNMCDKSAGMESSKQMRSTTSSKNCKNPNIKELQESETLSFFRVLDLESTLPLPTISGFLLRVRQCITNCYCYEKTLPINHCDDASRPTSTTHEFFSSVCSTSLTSRCAATTFSTAACSNKVVLPDASLPPPPFQK